MTVVQVFETNPPHHNEWYFKYFGVVTFTKDFARKSFYIQVFDIMRGETLFEQELYRNFVYNAECSFFHQFEGEDAIIGLNFADEGEANNFNMAIDSFLKKKKNKENVKPGTTNERPMVRDNSQNDPSLAGTNKLPTYGRAAKKKLSKSDIGLPENFRHIQHVGLDSGPTAAPSTLTDESFLSYIAVLSNSQPTDLEEPGVKEMLMNYVKSKGGIKNVYKKIRKFGKSKKVLNPSSPLPMESIEDDPKTHPLQPPFPPSGKKPNYPISSAFAPSPPTPPASSKPSSININTSPSSLSSPPAPPPPPPPPPLPQLQVAPESYSTPPTQPKNEYKPPAGNNPANDETSSRSNLLNEIRNPSIKLKHVDSTEDESYSRSAPPFGGGGGSTIINFLAKALEDRGRACRGDSDYDTDSSYSSSDDADDDDDDW